MKKILAVVSLALVTIFAGCNKEDKLWDAIDALKNRVEALETQVNQLNTNVLALTKLHKDGSTVTSSVKDPLTGTWKITLSNGDVIDLKQGTEASATIPVMAINDAGNWEVSYDNGTTFTEIKRDGQPVKAETVSPLFRVDNDGFWQVSYDGGAKYDFVLDEKNQRVYAFKDGAPTDSFFTSVDVVDGELVIVMKNGEKLSVPIVKDFYCRILDVPADPIKFDAGAVKMYTVELKGVDNTIITTPEGWKAKLGPESNGSATLTVTAPAAAPIASKAATADSNKDIAILATSNKYATIAKLQVELVGGGEVAPPTLTSVAENAASKTATSLTFDVVMSTDASGVKYICQLANAQAPTIQNVIDNGTAVAKASLPIVVENLLPLTTYKIYVVAYKGSGTITYGETVLNAEATTKTDVVDYYTDGVTIDGVLYNSSSAGAEILTIPANATADVVIAAGATTQARVIFLEQSQNAAYNYTYSGTTNAINHNLIIIGRFSDQKPVVKTNAGVLSLANANSNSDIRFAFKNLTIDRAAGTQYLMNMTGAKGDFTSVVIEDCKIIDLRGSVIYANTNTVAIGRLIFRNNSVQMNAAIGQLVLNGGNSTDAVAYKYVEVDNNIIYGTTAFNGQLVNIGSGATQIATAGDTWDGVIKITRNTIVNYTAGNSVVRYCKAGTLDVSKNIFSPGTGTTNTSMYNEFGAKVTTGTIVTPTVTLDNVVYGGTGVWSSFGTGSTLEFYQGDTNAIVKATDNPLTTNNTTIGVFVRSAAMIAGGYGSSLK